MAYSEGITLNPQAFTGENAGATIGSLSRTGDGSNNKSLWALSGTTSTQPVHLDIQHQEIKKGKATYIRSTIGFTRKNLTAPTGDPESTGANGYSSMVRLTIERPKISGVIADILVVSDIGRLLSFFGVTLATSGTPNSAVAKFLNRET